MATHNSTAHPHFSGFQSPNFTSVPDEVFDVLLPDLSGAELKVLLYIIRRTFGFKKQQDDISLRQMVSGITTKDGRVLDRGTGLSKESVINAATNLVARSAIIRRRNHSPQHGDEATTYALNLSGVSDNPTGRGQKTGQPPVEKVDTPPVQKFDPQQTVLQQTVKQETVLVGGVVGALTEFGISENAAYQIATKHDPAYIQQKIEQVQWLMANQPEAVAKNPAGYLRRAIEENFSPPTGYHRQAIRAQAKSDLAQDQEQDVLAGEERAPELPEPSSQAPMRDSEDATQNTWEQALARIKERQLVTRTVFETWLRESRLLAIAGETAYLGFANRWIARQVERQLYTVVTQALADIIGRPIDVQCIALQEPEAATIAA